jgi:hypothetical protein
MFVTAECGAEICRGYNGQCARTGLHPIERPSLDASNTSISPHAIFVYVYSPILSTPRFKSPSPVACTQRSLADDVFERMLELE